MVCRPDKNKKRLFRFRIPHAVSFLVSYFLCKVRTANGIQVVYTHTDQAFPRRMIVALLERLRTRE